MELIGQGRTADVYSREDAQVIKLFHQDFPEEWAACEFNLTSLAYQAGLAAPAVIGREEIDGRNGIIYERVEGPSMIRLLLTKPWSMFGLVRSFAGVQADMHRTVGKEFPSQRKRLEDNILKASQLDRKAKDRLLQRLHTLPDGEFICHGDYHPDNVVFSPRGPVVIDWMTAVKGNPAADVARTSLMFETPYWLYNEQGIKKWLLHLGRAVMFVQYLLEYRRVRPVTDGEIRAWYPVIAAARLVEQVPMEEAWLLGIVQRALEMEN